MTADKLSQAFDLHSGAVFGFAYRMTQNSSTAEDVTQEVFTALASERALYDAQRGTLRTFLLSVARNQVLKHLRANGRWAPSDEPHAIEPMEPAGQETAALVAQAIASLSPLQREVLVLAEYEGLSLREIAQTVGAELSAVKARLHRARENLRRLLAPLRPAQGVSR